MVTTYETWKANGSHWELAAPARRLRDRLRARGFTVYDIGNLSHLTHIPPEDHTPYSATGWPDATPYGVVTALDIMPGGPMTLQALGARFKADRDSGKFRTLKYMNWGPVSDSSAVQDRWTPGYSRRSSTDTGHIHLSFRSDMVDVADDYDPFGVPAAPSTRERKMFLAIAGNGQVFRSDGMRSVPFANEDDLTNFKTLVGEGLVKIEGTLTPRQGWYEGAFGYLDKAPAAVNVQALAAALAPLLQVPATDVLGVLQSSAGQEALARAAEYAEDH